MSGSLSSTGDGHAKGALRYPVVITREVPDTRFELAGSSKDLGAALATARLPVPTGPKAVAADAGGVAVAWIGPRRMVVSAPLNRGGHLGPALAAAFARLPSATFAEVTGATVTFRVAGGGVWDVLAQGVVHDLTPAGFPLGSVLATDAWGVAVLLAHADEGAVRLTVEAPLAGYLESWLRTAAGEATPLAPGTMRAGPGVG